MKRIVFILGLIGLIGFCACHSNQKGKALISRTFPTHAWERFDFVEQNFDLKKPVSYDLSVSATFGPEYPFDYFAMAFTVFDNEEHPLRSKNYQFTLKDRDGTWKSECVDGVYHFIFPINNAMTLNEPGRYKFQIENRMPITPLLDIREIILFDNN